MKEIVERIDVGGGEGNHRAGCSRYFVRKAERRVVAARGESVASLHRPNRVEQVEIGSENRSREISGERCTSHVGLGACQQRQDLRKRGGTVDERRATIDRDLLERLDQKPIRHCLVQLGQRHQSGFGSRRECERVDVVEDVVRGLYDSIVLRPDVEQIDVRRFDRRVGARGWEVLELALSRLRDCRCAELSGDDARYIDVFFRCVAEPALHSDGQSSDARDRGEHARLGRSIGISDVELAGTQ